ncbi:MAG: hypothetical protein SFU98_02540 [Leptospiraceae bacterium]|nr:hypothetical protein [Leptospiraceae bacterium]
MIDFFRIDTMMLKNIILIFLMTGLNSCNPINLIQSDKKIMKDFNNQIQLIEKKIEGIDNQPSRYFVKTGNFDNSSINKCKFCNKFPSLVMCCRDCYLKKFSVCLENDEKQKYYDSTYLHSCWYYNQNQCKCLIGILSENYEETLKEIKMLDFSKCREFD